MQPLSYKVVEPAADPRPAMAIGLALIANAILVNLLFRADTAQVWILGRPIVWACGMRQVFGIPCPTCGLTRSVVLSLHGELATAWSVAPAGILIAAGLVGFGVALLSLALVYRLSASGICESLRNWLTKAAWIYGGLLIFAGIGGWIASLFAIHNPNSLF